jgi:diguanylate cyclase (GGDEF)-like protein
MPPKLAAVVGPVVTAGLTAILAAAWTFASEPENPRMLASVGLLLAAFTLSERFPVPVHGAEANGVSLGFVFAVAAILLFGWDVGVLVAALAPVVMQLLHHRPAVRIAYNGSTYALAAVAAGAATMVVPGAGSPALVARTAVCGAVFHAVDTILITTVVAVSARCAFAPLLRSNVRRTVVPFALMASASLILVIVWQRSPGLSVALIGPLIAISLYQRAAFRELRAMRLALTDPLTGLGNHRHFHERLQRELQRAEQGGTPLALCLVDVDDFKRVNDTFGHPAGDLVLSRVAGRLRQGGEAFRLGGDEFALILPGHDARDAATAAESVVDRIASLDLGEVGDVTVSAGLASFPSQGAGRDELIRLADSALYWAKEQGKNCFRVYRPDVVELAELRQLAAGTDRAARFRAAAALARAVDVRDAYTGSHSERVGDLAARVASRLGASPEEVELTRLAASLHDLGKLAIPEEILCKAGRLSEPERLVLERHPRIGFRMLESLGVGAIAEWVLHHHERWDGAGYPDGIRGERIPLGARIIFVADAFDAMTSDRVYRASIPVDEALGELGRCAGTQFDPTVVSALVDEIEDLPTALAS